MLDYKTIYLPKKKYREEGNEKLENKEIIKEWKLKNGDNYAKILVGKFLDKKILIKGKPVCQRFCTKLFWIEKFSNKDTYLNSKDLPHQRNCVYSNHYKLCCKE